MPLLGVCLGHQSIGQAFGAKIVRCGRLMHGKTDMIHHDNRGFYEGLPNPFQATRYHSLVIQPDTLSDEFDVCRLEHCSRWARGKSWACVTRRSAVRRAIPSREFPHRLRDGACSNDFSAVSRTSRSRQRRTRRGSGVASNKLTMLEGGLLIRSGD